MNALRVSFLIATDVLVIAMLVFLLAGCVATTPRQRNGDFVSHIASTQPLTARERNVEKVASAEVNPRPAAAPAAALSAPRT